MKWISPNSTYECPLSRFTWKKCKICSTMAKMWVWQLELIRSLILKAKPGVTSTASRPSTRLETTLMRTWRCLPLSTTSSPLVRITSSSSRSPRDRARPRDRVFSTLLIWLVLNPSAWKTKPRKLKVSSSECLYLPCSVPSRTRSSETQCWLEFWRMLWLRALVRSSACWLSMKNRKSSLSRPWSLDK